MVQSTVNTSGNFYLSLYNVFIAVGVALILIYVALTPSNGFYLTVLKAASDRIIFQILVKDWKLQTLYFMCDLIENAKSWNGNNAGGHVWV